MADVKAFCALRYAPDFQAKYQDLITPPYDVITKEMQEGFYDINPYNIIRLEWGKVFSDDTEENNRYTRAAADFLAWQKDNVLIRDDDPAFYLYAQEFSLNNERITRSGFIARIKAEGYASGNVLPHEETLPKHKEDRLKLMRHTYANFSPIFGLYADRSKKIDRALQEVASQKPADVDFCDSYGVRHKLWKIDNKNTVSCVEEAFRELKVYIADGHHRYETASYFAEEAAKNNIPGCDYMMIDLVNLYDEGLLILPTHRMVKNMGSLDLDGLLAKLVKAGFTVSGITGFDKDEALKVLLAKMKAGGKELPSFGLYSQGQFYLLTLPEIEKVMYRVRPEKSSAYRKLDVTLLHTLILEDIFGIGNKELAEEGWIAYTRNENEAVSKVDKGEYQCSFLLNSTLIQELLDVAGAGEKMPQKSTYFYPKIIAGLTINRLE